MLSVMDSLYCSIRREEFRKLSRIIRRLTVDKFYEVLTKNCWEFGIQYEILIKNNEILEIKLSGMKRQSILKYHTTAMVFEDEYEKFVNTLARHDIYKGIYITTGIFDFEVIQKSKGVIPSKRKVKLEDCFSFYRKQMGLFRGADEVFKAKNFKLYRYLPS